MIRKCSKVLGVHRVDLVVSKAGTKPSIEGRNKEMLRLINNAQQALVGSNRTRLQMPTQDSEAKSELLSHQTEENVRAYVVERKADARLTKILTRSLNQLNEFFAKESNEFLKKRATAIKAEKKFVKIQQAFSEQQHASLPSPFTPTQNDVARAKRPLFVTPFGAFAAAEAVEQLPRQSTTQLRIEDALGMWLQLPLKRRAIYKNRADEMLYEHKKRRKTIPSTTLKVSTEGVGDRCKSRAEYLGNKKPPPTFQKDGSTLLPFDDRQEHYALAELALAREVLPDISPNIFWGHLPKIAQLNKSKCVLIDHTKLSGPKLFPKSKRRGANAKRCYYMYNLDKAVKMYQKRAKSNNV